MLLDGAAHAPHDRRQERHDPVWTYPDPDVEALMKHAGDEVMQAVNRIRAFDRTAATCCDVRYLRPALQRAAGARGALGARQPG